MLILRRNIDLKANKIILNYVFSHLGRIRRLVLSTIHTNDAPGAVTRLINMGIAPFMVASSVTGVVAHAWCAAYVKTASR